MNELDHGILVVPYKQQQEWSEKFRPEQGFGPEFFVSHCNLSNTEMQ